MKLVDQVTSVCRFSRVVLAYDDNVDVKLFFIHIETINTVNTYIHQRRDKTISNSSQTLTSDSSSESLTLTLEGVSQKEMCIFLVFFSCLQLLVTTISGLF